MKSSDLTETERKVWQAAATGTLVDLRVGDSQLDSPERWAEWGKERTVRAEVIADLLISAINLYETTAVSVRLSGSHVPTVLTEQLRTRGDLRLDKDCSVIGVVELTSAHIGGQLDCTGGHFANPNGPALNADGLTIDGGMFCREGFVAIGEVCLLGAHITGQLACMGGQFSNPDGSALNLERATVSGPLIMQPAVLQGRLDLTAATTSSYHDNRALWPQKLRLDGFLYDAIEDASAKKRDVVKERLEWLRRNEKGYSPQIYDQLAVVYRAAGHDDDARRILIAKQRRRFAQRNPAWQVWGHVLNWMVGYGYRTERAALWLVVLLIIGNYLFGYYFSRGDLTPASKTNVPPPFQPLLYTLDLLLPVASLHLRDAWVAKGAAQCWSAGFIVMGWVLATAVVLSLTGLLKRDS
jgi:hypothetical protein